MRSVHAYLLTVISAIFRGRATQSQLMLLCNSLRCRRSPLRKKGRKTTGDKTTGGSAAVSATEISCKTERLNNVIYERAKNGKTGVIITETARRSASNLNGGGTNGFSKLRVFE